MAANRTIGAVEIGARCSIRVRATHPIPAELPEPPSAWRDDYLGLTAELDIGARTIEDAMAAVRLLRVMTSDDLRIARGYPRSSAAVAAIASGSPGAGIHISFRGSPA
jgi:hypothetical protein